MLTNGTGGCGHCNYASPLSLNRMTRYGVARDPGQAAAAARVFAQVGGFSPVLFD